MERQADLMIYITRTRFLYVMISRYNDYFGVRPEVCFAVNLRLLLTFYANGLSFYANQSKRCQQVLKFKPVDGAVPINQLRSQ